VVKRVAILMALILAACGADGPPLPPEPKQKEDAVQRAPGETGPTIAVGGRAYMGGMVSR